jgi:serine/threonine protein kinase
LVRELGAGAYGLVVFESVSYRVQGSSSELLYPFRSVQDEITGEIIAIKLLTRVFDKLQLAKRALREITLLRHFNNHDNVCAFLDFVRSLDFHLDLILDNRSYRHGRFGPRLQ